MSVINQYTVTQIHVWQVPGLINEVIIILVICIYTTTSAKHYATLAVYCMYRRENETIFMKCTDIFQA